MQTLLLAGANPEVKTKNDSTALTLTVEENHIDIIMMLAQQIRLNKAFALIGVDSQAFAQCLQKGLSPDSKNTCGYTLLMVASQKNDISAVKSLLEAGANIQIQDKDGCTALMFASKNGHTDIERILESAIASEKQGSLTSTCSTEASQKECHPSNATTKAEPNRRLSSTQAGIFHTDAPQNETARTTHDGNSKSKEAPQIR